MANFSASVLNNVFITYYVEMFLSVSRLSSAWFMSGQVLYCIWNCANDPILGWLGMHLSAPLITFVRRCFANTPLAIDHPPNCCCVLVVFGRGGGDVRPAGFSRMVDVVGTVC